MEQDELKIQDQVCLCTFTTKELTCLLMASSYTYGHMSEGTIDSEAWELMTQHSQESMAEMMGGLRPKLMDLIFAAIGEDNANRCMAAVEQQMMKRDGTKPN